MNEVVLIMIEAHDGFAVNYENEIKDVIPLIARNYIGKDISIILYNNKILDYNRIDEHGIDNSDDYVEISIESFDLCNDGEHVNIEKVLKKLKKQYLLDNDIVTDADPINTFYDNKNDGYYDEEQYV